MYFRPLPVLTFIAIPALAALVWLGVWQAQRAGWKAQEIADFQKQADSLPRPYTAICGAGSDPTGVVLSTQSARGDRQPEAAPQPLLRMFGQDSRGAAGWSLLQTAPAPDCGGASGPPVIVEIGFLQMTPEGTVGLLGPLPDRYIVAPWPAKPAFAAANSPETNDWHWFDAPAMAAALEVPELNTASYLKAFDGELPAHLSRTPPETHIGYAVTWFGMAIGFVVIYALFHARAGRLRFRKRKPGQQ